MDLLVYNSLCQPVSQVQFAKYKGVGGWNDDDEIDW